MPEMQRADTKELEMARKMRMEIMITMVGVGYTSSYYSFSYANH
jgi:hypothetical protein